MTEPSSSAVELAVAARIAAARRREAEKKQQREELAAARAAGLAVRHAQRLRHQAQTTEEAPMAATPRPSARTVHCPACRGLRPAQRVAGIVLSRIPHDVLRCCDSVCGLIWCAPPERPRVAA